LQPRTGALFGDHFVRVTRDDDAKCRGPVCSIVQSIRAWPCDLCSLGQSPGEVLPKLGSITRGIPSNPDHARGQRSVACEGWRESWLSMAEASVISG